MMHRLPDLSPPPRRRRRRGVEAIEFAMILPLFVIIIFAVIEFSWYMFQRGGVVDAARRGCRAAAQVDPEIDDIQVVAGSAILAALTTNGVDCSGADCDITIADASGANPPRLRCRIEVGYDTLTGLFGQSGSGGSASGLSIGQDRWGGVGIIPDHLTGEAVAIYEGGSP